MSKKNAQKEWKSDFYAAFFRKLSALKQSRGNSHQALKQVIVTKLFPLLNNFIHKHGHNEEFYIGQSLY